MVKIGTTFSMLSLTKLQLISSHLHHHTTFCEAQMLRYVDFRSVVVKQPVYTFYPFFLQYYVGIWYQNDGKHLKISLGPFRSNVSKTRKKPLEFYDFAAKKFDKNGLYSAEELQKSHALLFEIHDIHLVNEHFNSFQVHFHS